MLHDLLEATWLFISGEHLPIAVDVYRSGSMFASGANVTLPNVRRPCELGTNPASSQLCNNPDSTKTWVS